MLEKSSGFELKTLIPKYRYIFILFVSCLIGSSFSQSSDQVMEQRQHWLHFQMTSGRSRMGTVWPSLIFLTSQHHLPLDYCNALYIGLPLKKHWEVSTTAECSCMGNKFVRYLIHVTLRLHELQWLPRCFWMQFKVLVVTFKPLHSLGPYCPASGFSHRCTDGFLGNYQFYFQAIEWAL